MKRIGSAGTAGKNNNRNLMGRNLWTRMYGDIRGNIKGAVLAAVVLSAMSVVCGRVCPMRIILGIPCPGCGLTRAGVLLLKGDLRASLEMNPMLIPVLGGVVLFVYERYFADRHWRLLPVYVVCLIAVMTAVYFFRMARWFPDRSPMVYEPDNLLYYLNKVLNFVHNLACK